MPDPTVTVYYRGRFEGDTRPIFGHIFAIVDDGAGTVRGLDYGIDPDYKIATMGPAIIVRDPKKIDMNGADDSVMLKVTRAQADAMIKKIDGPQPANYTLMWSSCTTVTADVLRAGGLNVSKSRSCAPAYLFNQVIALGGVRIKKTPSTTTAPTTTTAPSTTAAPKKQKAAPIEKRGFWKRVFGRGSATGWHPNTFGGRPAGELLIERTRWLTANQANAAYSPSLQALLRQQHQQLTKPASQTMNQQAQRQVYVPPITRQPIFQWRRNETPRPEGWRQFQIQRTPPVGDGIMWQKTHDWNWPINHPPPLSQAQLQQIMHPPGTP